MVNMKNLVIYAEELYRELDIQQKKQTTAQPDGKLLADRALSRLLEIYWSLTFDELDDLYHI